MSTPLSTAIVGFVVCFAVGTALQFATGQPRGTLFAGVITSPVVALYIYWSTKRR